MFGLGITELIIIAVLIFLFFGAKRLPTIAQSVGKSINSFKKGLKDDDDSEKKA